MAWAHFHSSHVGFVRLFHPFYHASVTLASENSCDHRNSLFLNPTWTEVAVQSGPIIFCESWPVV